MRKILLAVVALSLLAGSTAQAFPFKKKKKKAKDSKSKRKGMDIMTPSGQIKLPGSDEVMQSTGSDITDVLHGSEPTDPIAEETSSATAILEERQKPSHKGYFKIVKEIMLTHTDEVI